MAVKLTLLEMVQDILEDINGDEVNSINDTEESTQVAGHIKKTYRNLVSNSNWPHTRELVTLTPRSDSTKPTHFTVQEDVKLLEEVYYNTEKTGASDKNYTKMDYLPLSEFMMKVNK